MNSFKTRLATASLAFLLCFNVAWAHVHLKSSVPANNAALTSTPAQLTLQFSAAVRVTSLSVQKEGETESTKIASLPKEPAAEINVPLQPLAPGKYIVNWRALGGDNHVMSGSLRFSVDGK